MAIKPLNRKAETRISALCLGLTFAAVGCKSKEATEAPAAATAERAAEATPRHTVFAASAHVRVVDAAAGAVVGRVQLQKAVREIRFSPDGATAYVAASDGVRAIDAKSHEVLTKLTDKPARYIELSADGAQLSVLEHWVKIGEDGSRTPQPFSLVTVDTRTGQVTARQEVGERVLYARAAPSPDGRSVHVAEDGKIVLGQGGAWGEGEAVDLRAGLGPEAVFRVRKTLAHHGDTVFVPVEGDPARVLEIDTTNGRTRWFSIGEQATLRGLGVTPDGATLLVNTGLKLFALDRATGRAQGEPLVLPGDDQPADGRLGGYVGCAVSDDGRFAYLARVKDGAGGAVTVVDIAHLEIAKKIHLDDISPWAIAVAPTAKVAAR